MKKILIKMWRGRPEKYFLQTFLLLTLLFFTAGMPDVQAAAAGTLTSHGNLVYKGNRDGASLYAADFLLLEEKISTIPEQCFDSARYTHTHHWEYCGINEDTHTKHCADCKENSDLTSPHKIDHWEHAAIFYEGKTYAGKRYTCACGYQWCMEQSHTLLCEALGKTSHQSRCSLDGTPYCQGFEPFVEEHYVWYYEPGKDEQHHKKICLDCGFSMEEDCRFEDADEEGRRVCICGNCETQDDSEKPDAGDESEKPKEPGPSGTPDTEDNPDESEGPETPNPPDTGDNPGESEESETPDPSDTDDNPGDSEGSETPDPPDTDDNPGDSEGSETPDPPDTDDNPGESQGSETSNPPDAGDVPEKADPSDAGNASTIAIEGGL